MKSYLQCLQLHQYNQSPCKHIAKAYLQCRMDSALFHPRELHNLGFHEIPSEHTESHQNNHRKILYNNIHFNLKHSISTVPVQLMQNTMDTAIRVFSIELLDTNLVLDEMEPPEEIEGTSSSMLYQTQLSALCQ
ncbi:uncharacterized protein T551_03091 [Pneumocystis jirovecii RU7]|uniref:CHCH domain-containing protein n=1 Tax=Pneumocystis jirovecii (strain RU7) TaxID=1408657 RepID=A0A0W4ZGU9_PNEJ7|nr:uncharacterized protein T551_03091 [Pneumocystis jirovecii RU7]KTW27592.1 hypothetical protein T551_03091 [Pneumocystis jirovecii RU7]